MPGKSFLNPALKTGESRIFRGTHKETISQYSRCPLPKARSYNRLNSVSNRNNHIQAVICNRLVRKRNMQKMHIAFAIDLPFAKHIAYMSSYYRLIPLE